MEEGMTREQRLKAWKAIVLLLLLAGCSPLMKSEFPQTCDVREADKDGQGGYTKGTFACALRHYPAPTAPPAPATPPH